MKAGAAGSKEPPLHPRVLQCECTLCVAWMHTAMCSRCQHPGGEAAATSSSRARRFRVLWCWGGAGHA